MTRGVRSWLLLAAALMAAGTALPWGSMRTVPWHEVVTVGAFGHGGELVLLLAALLATAALLRRPAAAMVLSGIAALLVVGVAWGLPDSLLDSGAGAYEAGAGLGLDLALLGAFVAGCTAAAIVAPAINHAAPSSMARRHALQERPPA